MTCPSILTCVTDDELVVNVMLACTLSVILEKFTRSMTCIIGNPTEYTSFTLHLLFNIIPCRIVNLQLARYISLTI